MKAVHSIHGYLFSFTETTFINYHDPVTLKTIGTFNMREAKTFPKDAFCQTQTAHGHYDDQGSFWNVMGCMRGSDSEDHPGSEKKTKVKDIVQVVKQQKSLTPSVK